MAMITSYWKEQAQNLNQLVKRNEMHFSFEGYKKEYTRLEEIFGELEQSLKKGEDEFFFTKDYTTRLVYSFFLPKTPEKIALIFQKIIRNLTCGATDEEREKEYRSHIPDRTQLEVEAKHYEELAARYFKVEYFDLECMLENLRCAAFCHRKSSAFAEADRIVDLIALLTTPCKIPNLLKNLAIRCEERGVHLHLGDTQEEHGRFTEAITTVFQNANDKVEAFEANFAQVEMAKDKIEEYWRGELIPELQEKMASR